MRVIRAEQLMRSPSDANAALERHCLYSAVFEVAGVCVELRTDMPDVAHLHRLRYADHASGRTPDFRYFVATVRGGYAFWCSHAPSWRWTRGALPADAVAFLADSVIIGALVRYDAALCSVQAAGIEYNGIAAALAGPSATGKTETLLACARRGMRLYSDERVVLRHSIAYPFLCRSSVRAAGTRLMLSDPDADPIDPVRTAPELSLKTCFGSSAIADPRPLRALFAIAGTGHCAALELVDTATVLPTIARGFDSRGDMVDRVSRVIAMLGNVRCYRLTLGSPDETSAAIAYAMMRMGSE
ncbi:MAG TPA: hypothetical protein VGZ02_12620 [Candidatus Baltobacteraceae bacterium]|jgi:hypothetical protein|nr:hypothetical protein [Candidatus Baltobacteraceae bacterium]